jgi:hypothetical protein
MGMVEVGGDSVLCLPGKRRSVLPSPPGAAKNPSMGLPVMVCCRTHDNGTRAAFDGGEAQAAESVGNELEAPKADGFAKGKPSPRECLPLVRGQMLMMEPLE